MFSPVKGSPNYDPDFEKQWTQYDPAAANKLLDESWPDQGQRRHPQALRRQAAGNPATIHNASAYAVNPDEGEVIKTLLESDRHQRQRIRWSNARSMSSAAVTGLSRSGTWDLQRCSIVMADPGAFTSQYFEGPWAHALRRLVLEERHTKSAEPPADHLIRKVCDLWDKTQVEADETKRNALFKQLLDIHKAIPGCSAPAARTRR